MNKREQQFIHAHMRAAKQYQSLSYCERKKVGCILVKEGSIISFGFNGTAPGEPNVCEDTSGNTHRGVIHAEKNAIVKLAKNGGPSSVGADVYVTYSPCWECSILLFMAGVSRLYFEEQYRDTSPVDWLESKGVECFQVKLEEETVTDWKTMKKFVE